jgi:hypothetical protein
MNMKAPLALFTLALSAAAPLSARAAEDGQGWDWMVAPYVWATSVSTDLQTTVPPIVGGNVETDFSGIIDKLDGAFLIHAEGQGDDFGAMADFIFLGLAHDRDRENFSTEADLDTRVLELAGVWSPGAERYKGIEILAGVRSIDVELNVGIDPAGSVLPPAIVNTKQTFTDFMVGGRYAWDLSPRWGMSVRGDASFGDTEGTWSLNAIAQYRTRNGAWAFGYRHMDVSLEPTGKKIDLVMSGPVVGYAFRF